MRQITPKLWNFERVLHTLAANQEVPRHTHLHSRGSTRVPPTSRGAPFPPGNSRRGFLYPAWSGKNSRHSRRISRGGTLHRKGERNSRVMPPFPESARKFLVGNFIGLPRKPSYSTFFLQLVFLLPYNFFISSYINKYTRLSTSTPSIRRIPWMQRGWTPAH